MLYHRPPADTPLRSTTGTWGGGGRRLQAEFHHHLPRGNRLPPGKSSRPGVKRMAMPITKNIAMVQFSTPQPAQFPAAEAVVAIPHERVTPKAYPSRQASAKFFFDEAMQYAHRWRDGVGPAPCQRGPHDNP